MGPSYLAAQAERGLNLYVSKCASCHGSSLEGGSGTPLAGALFQSRWANRSLRDLLYVIAMQMPLRAPGSLSDGEGFDLLAFILRKNEYSSGPVPLDASQAYALLFEGGAAPAAAQSDAPSLDLPGPATLYSRAQLAKPDDAELLRADDADWLMYNRDYRGQRYSGLRHGRQYIAVASGNSSRVTWGSTGAATIFIFAQGNEST